MKDLYLAIDGGQSGTVAIVADSEGTVWGIGHGGPIRHHEEADAEAFVRTALSTAIAEALGDVPDATISVCALALTGSTGLARSALHDFIQPAKTVFLGSDAFAALASGVAGRGGIVVIAGTGTVALAQGKCPPSARHILVGGWGWALGDEGSGFWIAMEGLKRAARAVDGTASTTSLTTQLPLALGQADMRAVYNVITGKRFDRTEIAKLARVVMTCAEEGDAAAEAILDRAAEALADLAIATAEQAEFLDHTERVVVLSGGIFSADSPLVPRVRSQLIARLPAFTSLVPDFPPVVGAYFLALETDGIAVTDDIEKRLRAQVLARPELQSKTAASRPAPTALFINTALSIN